MTRSLRFALPFLAAALAASPASAQPATGLLGARPVLRHFQDWLLACDNTRVCRAQVTGQDGSLMIRRDPGPAGLIRVVIDGQDPSDGPSIPDAASIRMDGRAAPGGWRLDRAGENAKLEGPAALTFVWSIANGRTISYRAGTQARAVSLAGLTATLLAMDEAQGRTGTVTASVRPGARAPTSVPAAQPVPAILVPRPATAPVPRGFAASVRRASVAALRRADCETSQLARDNDDAVSLSRTEILVFIGCRLYNTSFGSLLFRAPRADPRRARVVVLPSTPGGEDAGDTGVYSDLEWDARTAILFSGGHSCAGSCGSRTRWTFDGREFRLAGHLVYEWGGAELLDLYRTSVRIRR
jgi:Protein of unknown function (DUF1176)